MIFFIYFSFQKKTSLDIRYSNANKHKVRQSIWQATTSDIRSLKFILASLICMEFSHSACLYVVSDAALADSVGKIFSVRSSKNLMSEIATAFAGYQT